MTPEEAAAIVHRWANIWISEVVDDEELNPRERYATAPQPLGEEMTEPTITYEELRRAFMEDDCSPNTEPTLYSLLEKNKPEPLFGRWATHPEYGRGIITSSRPDGDREVRLTVRNSSCADGAESRYVRPEHLTLDPVTLNTAEDFENAPEGTIVESTMYPKGVAEKTEDGWYRTGGMHAIAVEYMPTCRVIRWGENDH